MAKMMDEGFAPTWGTGMFPWDEWFNGRWWLLEPRKDFHQKPDSFRSLVIQAAARRGMKAQTRIAEEGVYIRAAKRDDGHGILDK